MSIVLLGSTSGSCTLQEQAVAGNTVLTLPTTSGTLLTTATPFSNGQGPAFSAYVGTNQSISAGTLTKVQFNTEQFDTASCFDASTNFRFTPNVAGYYQINLSANFASNTNHILVSIYKNGSRGVGGEGQIIATLTGGSAQNCSNIVFMNGSTDYLEGYAYSGNSNTLNLGFNNTFFSGALVRAA